ncbi:MULTISPECIES: TldD/PmbA family protein [unclassified Treponema]|uniref:TldD/PmbA family protein n=1 Tax=unclassified Treponema TaxID=2638727 RepID=UPI0020A51C11|nr:MULTISPECIES: TldD/PmbA family protein [unclassified Treponema]UTC68375.1 TldD/PmbA family protein [Treponema sp. OMZ 789]UTC71095.1 TldD/PmbA family protein [Treponema sp. OMZ 790]UTC73836.1 TldD/PmbA family protein [Treponema sp. OMZ 791]
MQYDDLKRHERLFSEYTELRIQENTAMAVTAVNGDLVNNVQSKKAGVCARSFKDGVWGFASSPEQTDEAIASSIKSANENVTFLAKKAGTNQKKLPAFTGQGKYGKYDSAKDADQKEVIEFIKDLENYTVKKYPELQSRTFSLGANGTERYLITSDKADAHTYISRANLFIQLKLISEGQPVGLYEVFGGYGQFKDLFDKPSLYYSKIDKIVENLKQKAEGVYALPGFHDVVLGPDLAGILAHEAIGHTTESDFVMSGSVAADFMNKEVATPLVTLVDFAYEYNGNLCPVPIWIDDEGVAAKDAVIIKDGILRSYMHNKQSAAIFKVDPTGNARANEFSDEPLVRMRNTAILPGKDKLEDMIASIEDGYYFVRSSNGQADSTSEFMFGVVLGYEIKNGKIGKAVKDCTIAGVAFDMLKTVTMVSDDMSWSNAGMCGKKQLINVGMGGPAIKCKIGVGGRE